MKAARCLMVVQVAACLALLIICASCGNRATSHELRVEDLELTLHPSGARIVTGTVHNDSHQAVRGAQVQVTLFDDKNRGVDGMFAVVRDIPAGGSADFREPVQSDYDVRGARVRSVLIISP
jgi:hypothetical protein